MLKNQWAKRTVLAGVWAMAVSTWASIGHYLLGLPDVGAILPAGVAVAILAWPFVRPFTVERLHAGQSRSTGQTIRS